MKIFLAGDDTHPIKASILKFHPYSLFSYHYFKKCPDALKRLFVNTANETNGEVISDSGLFTFMFGAGGAQNESLKFWEDYAIQYVKLAKTWGIKNLTIVECDTHKVAPLDTLWHIRENVFEKCGLPVMYVWHIEEGIDGLEELARRYDFIGISVLEIKQLFKGKKTDWKTATRDITKRLLDHGERFGKKIKIHLLGNTVDDMLKDHLCYSSDSTSWLAGRRFGNASIFNGEKMITMNVNGPTFREVSKNCTEGCAEARQFLEDWYIRNNKSKKCPEYMQGSLTCAYHYSVYQKYLDRNYQWSLERNKHGC